MMRMKANCLCLLCTGGMLIGLLGFSPDNVKAYEEPKYSVKLVTEDGFRPVILEEDICEAKRLKSERSFVGKLTSNDAIPKLPVPVASGEVVLVPLDGSYELSYSDPYWVTDNRMTRSKGVVYFNGHKETWYSVNEPGGVSTARPIPGKHVASDDTIRDADGYICVASSDLPFYSVVMTSMGPGKVYDCGCRSGKIDIYTVW